MGKPGNLIILSNVWEMSAAFNPCPVEMFVSICSSFEAGIAYAIASFK